MNFLKGKKTYIIAGLMLLKALVEVISGDVSISQFFQSPYLTEVLAALGLGTLRAGVEKNK